MGPGQYKDHTNNDLLEKARETYNVYHIHINHNDCELKNWKETMGSNLIVIDRPEDVSKEIVEIITKNKTQLAKSSKNIVPEAIIL